MQEIRHLFVQNFRNLGRRQQITGSIELDDISHFVTDSVTTDLQPIDCLGATYLTGCGHHGIYAKSLQVPCEVGDIHLGPPEGVRRETEWDVYDFHLCCRGNRD